MAALEKEQEAANDRRHKAKLSKKLTKQHFLPKEEFGEERAASDARKKALASRKRTLGLQSTVKTDVTPVKVVSREHKRAVKSKELLEMRKEDGTFDFKSMLRKTKPKAATPKIINGKEQKVSGGVLPSKKEIQSSGYGKRSVVPQRSGTYNPARSKQGGHTIRSPPRGSIECEELALAEMDAEHDALKAKLQQLKEERAREEADRACTLAARIAADKEKMRKQKGAREEADRTSALAARIATDKEKKRLAVLRAKKHAEMELMAKNAALKAEIAALESGEVVSSAPSLSLPAMKAKSSFGSVTPAKKWNTPTLNPSQKINAHQVVTTGTAASILMPNGSPRTWGSTAAVHAPTSLLSKVTTFHATPKKDPAVPIKSATASAKQAALPPPHRFGEAFLAHFEQKEEEVKVHHVGNERLSRFLFGLDDRKEVDPDQAHANVIAGFLASKV